jgi:hypothetical protein
MTKAYKVGAQKQKRNCALKYSRIKRNMTTRAHRLIAGVKHPLTTAGISPHVSHDTVLVIYRKPVDRLNHCQPLAYTEEL